MAHEQFFFLRMDLAPIGPFMWVGVGLIAAIYTVTHGRAATVQLLSAAALGTLPLGLLWVWMGNVSLRSQDAVIAFAAVAWQLFLVLAGILFVVGVVYGCEFSVFARGPKRKAIRGSGTIGYGRAWCILWWRNRGKLLGVPFGPFLLSFLAEAQHMLLVGTTGAGKTNYLKLILKNIAERVGSKTYPGTHAIILDPKREFRHILDVGRRIGAARDGREDLAEIVTFDLFDRRSTWWNIAADIEDSADCMKIA